MYAGRSLSGELFATVHELAPEAHLAMLGALVPSIDQGIPKTVDLAADASRVPSAPWRSGATGLAVFRPNPVAAAALEAGETPAGACCPDDPCSDSTTRKGAP